MNQINTSNTLYLERLNTDFVCWCSCERALVSTPAQMDCPWCGCGWLFTCMGCGKAFSFARAVFVPETLEELMTRSLTRAWGKPPTPDVVADSVQWMQILLKNVRPGRVYVYFDGFFVDADAAGIQCDGSHARHDLSFVPQVQAMTDPNVEKQILSNRAYWEERRLPDEEE